MKFQTLLSLLQETYEQGTTLQIPAVNELESPDLSQLITCYLQSQLTMTQVQMQPPANGKILYTGQINLLNQTLSATAIFYLTDSATDGMPQLTLAAALPAGWTFGTTFPVLKGQTIDTLTFTTPLFVLESYTTDATNTYPRIAQGFNFSGILQIVPSSVVSLVDWLLVSDLLLTGTLSGLSDPTRIAPTMTLKTAQDSSPLQIGSVALNTWIEVASGYTSLPDPPPDDAPATAIQQHELAEANTTLGRTTDTLELEKARPWIEARELPATREEVEQVLNSSVSLFGNLQMGSKETLTLQALLAMNPQIPFALVSPVSFETLAELASFAGGSSLSNLIPAQFPLTRYFSLSTFSLMIAPAYRTFMNLFIGVELQASGWPIIPNVVDLEKIGLSFFIMDPSHPTFTNISAAISATLFIARTFPLTVAVALPDVTIEAYLPPDEIIPVDQVLQQFIGPGLPATGLTIYELGLTVNPNDKTFSLIAAIKEDWSLMKFSDTVNLKLTSIFLRINQFQTGFTGQFIGDLTFVGVDFRVSATKTRPDDSSAWVLDGRITKPFSVGRVIENLTGWSPPSFLNAMNITEMGASYDTGDHTFTINAALQWVLPLADYHFELDLAFQIAAKRASKESEIFYQGYVQGSFSFLGLKPLFIYAFDQRPPHATSYTLKLDSFQVQFIHTDTDQVLVISFGNTTVGEILSWLIALADPGANAQLSAPWNALNSISLNNLTIKLDFIKRSVEIDYPLQIDLGFIKLSNVRIVYTQNYGQSQIELQLSGQFLGQTYDPTHPLSWDVLNDQPPAVPGAGTKLLDLQYAGLGQHITLLNAGQLTTMEQAIKAFEDTIVPVNDTTKNPLETLGGLRFDSGSNWLIGASFIIQSTFSISVVFNDPQLYGLLIQVSGPEAGIFEGLSFEILYRKITDDLGVYHIELKLPDTIRHLEFGEVSITLPIIDLDIYTNGNFRIDFGFPASLTDFSRSFNIQVFPFIGYGGFYLALLQGATSTNVPKIQNGTFNPVIEFGFALSVGVGKTLTIGPLSAGVSVTLLGLLEGVLGWFNPTDIGAPEALYYAITGTIGMVGKIYGVVDFSVVKASLNLTLYASVTLTLACYQPTILRIVASVVVEANVQILFITIHFSFHASINLSFTIGTTGTPPWQILASAPDPHQLRAQSGPYNAYLAALTLAERATLRNLRLKRPATFRMVGRAINDPDDGPLVVYATPAFSQALPDDLATPANAGRLSLAGASSTDPLVTANMLLFVENAISPQSSTAREAQVPTENAASTSFNALLTKLLRWAISALEQETDLVSATELAFIHSQLDDSNIAEAIFSYRNLTQFFTKAQVIFDLQARPTVQPQSGALSGTFFPMFPELTMSDGSGISVSFWDNHSVTPEYLQNLQRYFEQLLVQYENSVERDPTGNGSQAERTINLIADDPTSIAAFVFCSYFEMLTKAVVQSAQDYLQAYVYLVDEEQAPDLSLDNIAASFPAESAEYVCRRGDTLSSVATMLDLPAQTLAELLATQQIHFLQAGTRLTVPLGVTPLSIVVANQKTTDILQTGDSTPFNLPITGVNYQVKSGDNLESIAGALGVETPDLLTENAFLENILAPGTTINFGSLTYTGRTGDSRESVALYFGVPVAQVTSEGDTYTIQGVSYVASPGFLIPYTFKDGDSLDSIITYFFTPPELTPELRDSLKTVIKSQNPHVHFDQLTPGTLLSIPYNQTLANLARYYYPNLDKAKQLTELTPLVQTLQLTPLLVLLIPEITYPVQAQDTFASIAGQFNLTLEKLTESIALTKGIFQPGVKITIPDVPQLKIADLCRGLKESPLLNTAAGMTSRFFLQGLRLPYPQDTDDMSKVWSEATDLTTYPLYALTGQEYQLPETIAPDYTITLTQTRSAPWLQIPAQAAELPVGASLPLALQPDEISQITDLRSLVFQPEITLLTRLPLYAYSPQRFALQEIQHWQVAALPGQSCLAETVQASGEPILLPLPDTLQQRITNAQGFERLYKVASSTYADSSSGLQVSDIACYQWATSVDIVVQEIPAADYGAEPLSNTYLMLGTDDQGKQSLLSIVEYLNGAGKADQATQIGRAHV